MFEMTTGAALLKFNHFNAPSWYRLICSCCQCKSRPVVLISGGVSLQPQIQLLYNSSCLLGWWLEFTQNRLLVTQMTKIRVKNFSSSAPPSEWIKMFEVKSCTKLIAAWCPLMTLSETLGAFQSHSVNKEMSCSLRFRLWLRIGRTTRFSRGRRQPSRGG